MNDHLPAQHSLRDVTDARSTGLPTVGLHPLHPSHSAVSGLAAPLPSDVLLQVEVLGKGLVAVSAFQLGGLGFACKSKSTHSNEITWHSPVPPAPQDPHPKICLFRIKNKGLMKGSDLPGQTGERLRAQACI